MSDVQWQPGMTIDDIERDVIMKAYRFYGQNKTKTAESLGIAVRTLDAKLQSYDLLKAENERKLDERRAKDKELQVRAGIKKPYSDSTGVAEDPEARFRMEPPSRPAPQFALPVQKPEEVQKLPSSKAASGGAGKGRSKIS